MLQDELDQIMAEFLRPHQERYSPGSRSLDVPVDIYETEEAIHVRAEMPGMTAEDVELFISRDLLSIEGGKKPTYPADNPKFLNLEREFGKFKRDVGLSKPVDVPNIRATLENGVLCVALPKISDRRGKRKRIPVRETASTDK